MTDKPQHAPLTQFPIVDDQLMIEGLTVPALAERAGQTPFYAYSRNAIADRVSLLRDVLPPQVSLHYAMKANPMPAVVGHLAELADGIDVASKGELDTALACGILPAHVTFAGPGKSDADLEAAILAGATLNLESELEWRRALAIGDRLGVSPVVAVRVNPDFELKSSGMTMGGGPKPFGIDVECVPALLRDIAQSSARFRGFHIYSGSQNLDADRLVEAQSATIELALRLAAGWPDPIEMLNIGGGFGIPYFPGQRALDVTEVGAGLNELLSRHQQALDGTEIVIELGRYLVGEAGIYVCEVIDRKVSRGKTYLVTNGGLHHHLAASGNFGQLIRKNYPLVLGHRVAQEPRESVDVVGPLCTPLDILGEQITIGRAEVGDLLVVLQSGAYGYTASPLKFLGHPAPVELLV